MRWLELFRRHPRPTRTVGHAPVASGARIKQHLDAITEAQTKAAAELELIRREIELMRRAGTVL
jgi:hypothetical protein